MCSICELRIEFGVDHPWALNAAVAVRRGIDAGLVPEATDWDRDGAITLMHGVRDRLERVLPPETLSALPPFFLLLVETGTWAYFSPGDAGLFDPKIQRPPPKDFSGDAETTGREAIFLTAETALAPMLDGRLPFSQAIAEGMVMVDASQYDTDILQSAWSQSWPVSGFSRLVCS